jgi:hypothetical protein
VAGFKLSGFRSRPTDNTHFPSPDQSVPRSSAVSAVLSIPILGYIHGPVSEIPPAAFATRFVFVPAVILSGLWMWKGLVRQYHQLHPFFRLAERGT